MVSENCVVIQSQNGVSLRSLAMMETLFLRPYFQPSLECTQTGPVKQQSHWVVGMGCFHPFAPNNQPSGSRSGALCNRLERSLLPFLQQILRKKLPARMPGKSKNLTRRIVATDPMLRGLWQDKRPESNT